MAHVQHPNLVRLIAAVVDAGVERGTDSPLLVLEFLDTDLRSAYERKIVNFQKDALLSIFRRWLMPSTTSTSIKSPSSTVM